MRGENSSRYSVSRESVFSTDPEGAVIMKEVSRFRPPRRPFSVHSSASAQGGAVCSAYDLDRNAPRPKSASLRCAPETPVTALNLDVDFGELRTPPRADQASLGRWARSPMSAERAGDALHPRSSQSRQ